MGGRAPVLVQRFNWLYLLRSSSGCVVVLAALALVLPIVETHRRHIVRSKKRNLL
jgi:hypothetical protein